MEYQSFGAEILHTFLAMPAVVQVLLIYMPSFFGLGCMALYLHHLRKTEDCRMPGKPRPYTPPIAEPAPRQKALERDLDALRRLESYAANKEDGGRD